MKGKPLPQTDSTSKKIKVALMLTGLERGEICLDITTGKTLPVHVLKSKRKNERHPWGTKAWLKLAKIAVMPQLCVGYFLAYKLLYRL